MCIFLQLSDFPRLSASARRLRRLRILFNNPTSYIHPPVPPVLICYLERQWYAVRSRWSASLWYEQVWCMKIIIEAKIQCQHIEKNDLSKHIIWSTYFRLRSFSQQDSQRKFDLYLLLAILPFLLHSLP